MRLYMSGCLTLFGLFSALNINADIIEGYNISNPTEFWQTSTVFWSCIIMGIVYVATHWDMIYNIPKHCLVYTVIGIAISCAIAWINIEYAWIFIVLLGTIDALTVNRFYRLKLKNK